LRIEDQVGRRYALAVKECLNLSSLFELTYSKKEAAFSIGMLSTDITVGGIYKGSAISTVVSLMLDESKLLMNHFLDILTQQTNLKSRAEEFIAELDRMIRE